jgi:hypothetical protein
MIIENQGQQSLRRASVQEPEVRFSVHHRDDFLARFATRETVARAFRKFRENERVMFSGTTLRIPDRLALEKYTSH